MATFVDIIFKKCYIIIGTVKLCIKNNERGQRQMKLLTAVQEGSIIPGKHYVVLPIRQNEYNFAEEITGVADQKVSINCTNILCRLERFNDSLVLVSEKNLPITNLRIKGFVAWSHYHELAHIICNLVQPRESGIITDINALNVEHILQFCNITTEELGIQALTHDWELNVRNTLNPHENIDEYISSSYTYIPYYHRKSFINEFYGSKKSDFGYCYDLDNTCFTGVHGTISFNTLWIYDGEIRHRQLHFRANAETLRDSKTDLTFRFVATLHPDVSILPDDNCGVGSRKDPLRIKLY